jgi:hypothetical protein
MGSCICCLVCLLIVVGVIGGLVVLGVRATRAYNLKQAAEDAQTQAAIDVDLVYRQYVLELLEKMANVSHRDMQLEKLRPVLFRQCAQYVQSNS